MVLKVTTKLEVVKILKHKLNVPVREHWTGIWRQTLGTVCSTL